MEFEIGKHYRKIINEEIVFIRVDEVKDTTLKVARGVLSPMGIRIVSVDETETSVDGWEKVFIQ